MDELINYFQNNSQYTNKLIQQSSIRYKELNRSPYIILIKEISEHLNHII